MTSPRFPRSQSNGPPSAQAEALDVIAGGGFLASAARAPLLALVKFYDPPKLLAAREVRDEQLPRALA